MSRDDFTAKAAMGQVKFYKPSEGYGFLKVLEPEGTDDVFFHISDYKTDNVHKGWWMQFDISKTRSGLKAVNMRRVSKPPESELFGKGFDY
ncbi:MULTISPECIES: cold shock domain-containing protein [Haloferax]|uniref:CSD domain-containing protein n=1 Tax=Haloferax marinum TaxID=2666143 RepID=A0A6A8GBP9_9EURY|nr:MULTISPECIES: cold shock domain-containing protein [Haloferax]KAB1198544.1 cold shock domain-containing protein [Haloferax sp. CBA1150]MRW97653.1 hypothetical protein [Haloferax marinum]